MRIAHLAAVLSMLVATPALAQAPASSQKPPIDITLTTKPSPPRLGDNVLEVALKDASSKPITDAEVSVTFFMAAMPAMKMPEMRNTVALKHVKDGIYSGAGKVMMAGNWDVTVAVKRSSKEIGTKKFPITAK